MRQNKKDQEGFPNSTAFISIKGQLTAIATSPDGRLVGVAGRHILKLFQLSNTGFEEKAALAGAKSMLNYSFTDLQWNPNQDSTFATSAGNGTIMVWDIGKSEFQKQTTIQEHKRTVNSISFHPVNGHLLLSGSQDATVRCFDLRTGHTEFSINPKADIVRCIRFNKDGNCFAAAGENGCIQIWDMRHLNHPTSTITAHCGPVFSLDWHSEEKHWLASGGRDRIIKVWDVQSHQPAAIHFAYTIAPVARVRWRPGYRYQLASCSSTTDLSVNVWDVQRPYIPYLAFQEHNDVTIGVSWGASSENLLSCSKGGLLVYHSFQDAENPSLEGPEMGLAVSCNGLVVHTMDSRLGSNVGHLSVIPASKSKRPLRVDRQISSMLGALSRAASGTTGVKTPGQGEVFKPISTLVTVYRMPDDVESEMRYLAENYWLFGHPFDDLCRHNAKVCESVGLVQRGMVWSILEVMFTSQDHEGSRPRPTSLSETISHPGMGDSDFFELSPRTRAASLTNTSGVRIPPDEEDFCVSGVNLGVDFDDPENTQSFRELIKSLELRSNPSLPQGSISGDLPAEAFLPSASLQFSLDSEEENEEWSMPSTRPTAPERTTTMGTSAEKVLNQLIRAPFLDMPPCIDFLPIIKEQLLQYADMGDVQMVVSMVLVLGERIDGLIKESLIEEWLLSYIDILMRLQLYCTMALIIKNSRVESVQAINQTSTSFSLMCGTCRKPQDPPTWYCSLCKSVVRCSICHLPVRGLYVWCQGCGHGGHLKHIRDWIRQSKHCPEGCGHLCEYS